MIEGRPNSHNRLSTDLTWLGALSEHPGSPRGVGGDGGKISAQSGTGHTEAQCRDVTTTSKWYRKKHGFFPAAVFEE